jgi:hypothetical protein
MTALATDTFLEVVYGDDEWVQAEFDAIVAANWVEPAASPPTRRVPVANWPAPRRPTSREAGPPASRQRSPPGHAPVIVVPPTESGPASGLPYQAHRRGSGGRTRDPRHLTRHT